MFVILSVDSYSITQEEGITTTEETNREKFVRLAESRTNVVLDKIRVLSNCANPYAYEYSEEDVREIFAAIEAALRRARTRFLNGQDRDSSEFQLSRRSDVSPLNDSGVESDAV